MSSYHRCSRCSSDQMMDGAYIANAEASRIVVGVDRHPDHGRLTHAVSTQVHASVCGSCGHVELWANRPGELLEAYHRASRRASPASRATTP